VWKQADLATADGTQAAAPRVGKTALQAFVWGNGALTGERNLNDREGEESFARRAPQEE